MVNRTTFSNSFPKCHVAGLEIRKNRLIGANNYPPPPPNILEVSIKVQFSVVTLVSTLFEYSIRVVERQLTT